MLNRFQRVCFPLLTSVLALVVVAPAYAEDGATPVRKELLNSISLAPVPDTSRFPPYLFDSNFASSTTLPTAPVLQNDDENRSTGLGIGAKVGPVFSTFSADVLDEHFKNRTGFMAGIWFGGNRGGRVGVMGELMYIEKGTKDDVGGEITAKYLEIPVLVRINIGSRSKNGLSVYAIGGPSVNIKLDAQLFEDGHKNANFDDDYEGFDIDAIAGGGVEVLRFLVEARYDWGLRNVNKSLSDAIKIRTRTFELLFGLRFN